VSEGNHLAAVTPFARWMERAVNAVLRGQSVRQAFRPFYGRLKPELADQLKRAGVRSVRMLLVQLELTLHPRVSGPVTMFKLGVAPWPRPALAEVHAGLLPHGQSYRTENQLATYRGALRPLAKVARSVMRAVASGRCPRLPLVNPGEWSSLLPTRRDRADLTRDTASAQTRLAPACRHVRARQSQRLNLAPDDIVFGALDGAGKLVGMVRARVRWQGTAARSYIRLGPYFPRR